MKTIVTMLVVFSLVLGGAYALYTNLGQTQGTEQLEMLQNPTTPTAAVTQPPVSTKPDAPTDPTEQAQLNIPDVVVYDREGQEVRLSDFIGKPIVLNFWASWCPPCQMEMPDFQEKYRELEGEVIFLMINMTTGGETVQSAWEFIREKGYTFPVFYDTKGSAANAYSVYSLPTTFFIDAQGNGVARAVGAIDAATLQQGISMIS